MCYQIRLPSQLAHTRVVVYFSFQKPTGNIYLISFAEVKSPRAFYPPSTEVNKHTALISFHIKLRTR